MPVLAQIWKWPQLPPMGWQCARGEWFGLSCAWILTLNGCTQIYLWWRHTGNARGGGGLWMPKRGVFSNFSEGGWRHAGNVGGGGCWCSTHPSSDPPHLAGWLWACGCTQIYFSMQLWGFVRIVQEPREQCVVNEVLGRATSRETWSGGLSVPTWIQYLELVVESVGRSRKVGHPGWHRETLVIG